MTRAIAFASGMLLLSAAAQAQPAENLATLLDLFAPSVAYESVEAAPDGGVVVEGLTVSAAELGLLLQLPGADSSAVAEPDPAPGLTVGRLQLGAAAAAMLIGGHDGGPATIEATADDFRLDLAALADAAPFDQLARHLQVDALEGSVVLEIGPPAGGSFQVRFDADFGAMGGIAFAVELDERGVRLPTGTLTFTETEHRIVAGLGAWIRRNWLESALEMMELFPIADSNALALETVAQLRAAIEAAPATGREAAAALGAWARDMAVALPDHAAVLQALARFGTETGTLRVTLAPSSREGEIAFDLSAGPEPFPTPEQLAATIETLGISAEFMPAE